MLEKIKKIASEVAAQEGCFLYDVEFQGRDLRIFIDKEGGAGIDDCSQVSRQLNEIFDTEDPVPGGNYNLEVSTPGLERNLKEPWHFQKVIGKKVWLKTQQPLETYGVKNKKNLSSKQLSAVLLAADDQLLELEADDEKVKIPISAIEKAKLVFEMKEKGKKK
jgi:ribosome maturation factor RimP